MQRLSSILVIFIFVLLCSGCNLPQKEQFTPTIPPVETPDLESTVQAAIKATDQAMKAIQATVDTSISATQVVKPPAPTPTLINVSYVTEEEVAAMVEKEVNEALAASSACASTSSGAAADDTLTTEELAEIEAAVAASEEAISEATELAEQYMALYSELGEETITLLQQMESELAAMSISTAEIAATLDEINATLQQGLTLAEETINQLETQAGQIQAQVTEIQTTAASWKEGVKAELDNRANLVAGIQPDQIASDKAGALQQLNQYLNGIKTSFSDGRLSKDELNSLIKTGANASASLSQFGETGINIAEKVNNLNRSLARGETAQVMSNLTEMEHDFSSLNSSLRDLPSPNLPGLPIRK